VLSPLANDKPKHATIGRSRLDPGRDVHCSFKGWAS
jgi:hypothetical protein